jgi:raffinose/stachyose/melibiose transport system permease protein
MTSSTAVGLRAAAGERSPRRHSPTLRQWLWALPALIFVVGIVDVAVIANASYSTLDWNGVSADAEQVGLANFMQLATDQTFLTAFRNTLAFAVGTVALQMVLGFGLALLVRTRTFGRGLLRTLIFVPVVLSPAVVATSFRLLLTPDGQFNQWLEAIGLGAFANPWLANSSTALLTLIAINVWQYTGYSFVIYDAALGQIDPSLIEAARLDGAGTWRITRSLLLPMVSGSHLILIVLGFISSLKMFELVFLTTGGGPGNATQVLTGYIYEQAIARFHAGYASAISIVVVVLAAVFAALQVRLARSN